MCQVSSAKDHQYFDESQMNTSLLTTAYAIAKQLTKTTCSVQDATGQVMMGTIRKALAWKKKCHYNSSIICPFGIYTGPRYYRDCNESFCNTEHKDNDYVSKEVAKIVREYLEVCGSQKLRDFFLRMDSTFDLKEKIPLPTTCCWKLLEQLEGNGYRHHQYFAVTEGNLAFDLSSDVYKKFDDDVLLGGTFLGSLTSHLTTCSYWEHETKVTLRCPGLFALAAWGADRGPAGT